MSVGYVKTEKHSSHLSLQSIYTYTINYHTSYIPGHCWRWVYSVVLVINFPFVLWPYVYIQVSDFGLAIYTRSSENMVMHFRRETGKFVLSTLIDRYNIPCGVSVCVKLLWFAKLELDTSNSICFALVESISSYFIMPFGEEKNILRWTIFDLLTTIFISVGLAGRYRWIQAT